MLGPWDLNPSATFYLNPLFPHPTHRQESEPEMTGSFSSFHSQPKCHGLKIELLGGGMLEGCVQGTRDCSHGYTEAALHYNLMAVASV